MNSEMHMHLEVGYIAVLLTYIEKVQWRTTFQLYRDKIIIGTGISMKNRKIHISIIGHVKYISNDATTIKAKYCDILIGNFFLKF